MPFFAAHFRHFRLFMRAARCAIITPFIIFIFISSLLPMPAHTFIVRHAADPPEQML
jgi:hypothetical protein